jgi:multiple sugar transport system ATP-binding protein
VAFLELENLSKDYGEGPALDGLSLSVSEGELVTILGPSGSGKTTALRVIAGLERPDEGSVRIAGDDVADVPPAGRGVAMVFQSFALFPHMTVAQNIGFGLRARGTDVEETRRRVSETAEWLGLTRLIDRRPAQLSGGERQRVALARSLVGRPRVLLMDEPLSNLDAKLRVQTRAEIRRLHAELRVTTVYVTHDQGEALSMGSRVALVDCGRLQQYAAPREVYDRPANLFVAGFLGSPPMNLVPARVQADVARAGGVHVPLHGIEVGEGADVVLGFRAEHVSCPARGPDAFEAVLELSETVGHERVWHLRAGDVALTARPPANAVAAEGDRLRAAVDPAAVRLFHPATGERL